MLCRGPSCEPCAALAGPRADFKMNHLPPASHPVCTVANLRLLDLMPQKGLVSSLHKCVPESCLYRCMPPRWSRHRGTPHGQLVLFSQDTVSCERPQTCRAATLSHPLWFRLQSNYPAEQLCNSQVTSTHPANGIGRPMVSRTQKARS